MFPFQPFLVAPPELTDDIFRFHLKRFMKGVIDVDNPPIGVPDKGDGGCVIHEGIEALAALVGHRAGLADTVVLKPG